MRLLLLYLSIHIGRRLRASCATLTSKPPKIICLTKAAAGSANPVNLSTSGTITKSPAPSHGPIQRHSDATTTIASMRIESAIVKLLGSTYVIWYAYAHPAVDATTAPIATARIRYAAGLYPAAATNTSSSRTDLITSPNGLRPTRTNNATINIERPISAGIKRLLALNLKGFRISAIPAGPRVTAVQFVNTDENALWKANVART